MHSLLSLGGINAQKVGHLASEIGVGIPKKSNEIFCGSSKRLGSGAGKMLLLRLKPFFFCFSLPYHYLVVAKVVSLSWLLLSRGFSELRSSSQLLPRHIWIANEEEEAASSSSYAKLGPIVTLSNLQWLQVPKSTAAWRQPLLPAKLFPQPFGFHPSISKKVSLAST